MLKAVSLMTWTKKWGAGQVCCTQCHATSLCSLLSSKTVQLKLLAPVTAHSDSRPAIVLEGPDDEPDVDPTWATVVAERPSTSVIKGTLRPGFSKKTAGAGGIGGALAVGLLTLVVAALERGPWRRSSQAPLATSPSDALALVPPTGQPRPVVVAADSDTVEINVAYGTEKQQWLEEATAEFQKTPTGRSIKVNLHGMGSMEGARVVLDGPRPVPFHVWSPAS